MPEHLVFRSADFAHNPARFREIDEGECRVLYQSKVGHPPFKLDGERVPAFVHEGDTLWLAQTGYGVSARGTVRYVAPAEQVDEENSLRRIRRAQPLDFQLQHRFWKGEHEKLAQARAKGKPLWVCVLQYEVEDVSETFPLDLPRGLRASWVYLDDEKKRAYFRWRGVRSAEEHVLATGSDAYFTIPPVVRHM